MKEELEVPIKDEPGKTTSTKGEAGKPTAIKDEPATSTRVETTGTSIAIKEEPVKTTSPNEQGKITDEPGKALRKDITEKVQSGPLSGISYCFVGYPNMEKTMKEKKEVIAKLKALGAELLLTTDNLPTTKQLVLVLVCKIFWTKLWDFPWFLSARMNPCLRFLPNTTLLNTLADSMAPLSTNALNNFNNEICTFGSVLLFLEGPVVDGAEWSDVISQERKKKVRNWKCFVEKEELKSKMNQLTKEVLIMTPQEKSNEFSSKHGGFLQKCLYYQYQNTAMARNSIVLSTNEKTLKDAQYLQFHAISSVTQFKNWLNQHTEATSKYPQNALWKLDGSLKN
uniref:Uncharacterized protein n=1 Tax=Arcella intermedia TaxID=1963864 RepID=A0A6B2L5X6_9EUKA